MAVTPARGHFQAFTIRGNGLIDRIVSDIGVEPGFDPNNPPPDYPTFRTKALWDTGATRSVISPEVVKALALTPVGVTNILHAGGAGTSSRYVVHFRLPNQVGVAGVLVSEFQSAGSGFEVIVGMDVIALGDLSLSHVGNKTCMSFRMPSLAENDFVKEGNRRIFGKVGRNDACPCGAKAADGKQKKFKDCHQPLVEM